MKERLDVLLVQKGLAESREKAKTMIMEGNVFVDGQREDKAGTNFDTEAEIEVRGNTLKYVSRGGLKLEKAMKEFDISLEGMVCMDIGASTGGFTDCMLQNGAVKVYSVDVGYGQFAWKLRNDPRVVCMEKTNIRYVTPEDIADVLDFASVDVSFISLTKVLVPARELLRDGGRMVCLIKPQFEAGREKVGKKGVVRDPKVHEEVIHKVIDFALEIMNEDGSMARLPELRKMADEFNLKLISIRDMIAYRLKQESIVEEGVEVDMPTEHGHFRLIPFRQKSNGLEHVALFRGTWEQDEPILVRVHSSCATGDIFGSKRCDCGEQLHKAMEMINKAGKGVVVYLNQEGRGIGLMEKMKAYKLQEDGLDTVDANICLGHLADERDYGVGAQILRELGVHKMRLMTNNPVKRVGLEAYGLEITEIVPIETTPNQYNERYLRTKKERMGHTLHFNK